MKITVKTGLICALTWIIIKMAYHLIWPQATSLTPMILSNLFFLMCSVSMGLYLHKKQEGFTQGNAMSDIKAGMTSGVPYAVIVALFLFFYYNNINPQFVENIKKPMIEQLDKELSTEKSVQRLKNQNPELETKSRDEIYKMGLENINFKASPKFTSILSVLGMIIMSTLYSIFIMVVYRKVLVKAIR
ncbi:MAG: hypothetical protein K0R65_552 [Crocinitomicaceae bacterium]|jgi:hypothetical protein|nr:hypothetical protein [Crocinitomicaceae bacterium]